jgi:hypothetical protein
MRQVLTVSLLCSALVACGGGGSGSGETPPPENPLDPSSQTLEGPPSNGQLPTDLLPPA